MAIFYYEGVNKRLTKWLSVCPQLDLKMWLQWYMICSLLLLPKNISDYKVNTTLNFRIIKTISSFSKSRMKWDMVSLKGKNVLRRFSFYLNTKGQTFSFTIYYKCRFRNIAYTKDWNIKSYINYDFLLIINLIYSKVGILYLIVSINILLIGSNKEWILLWYARPTFKNTLSINIDQ